MLLAINIEGGIRMEDSSRKIITVEKNYLCRILNNWRKERIRIMLFRSCQIIISDKDEILYEINYHINEEEVCMMEAYCQGEFLMSCHFEYQTAFHCGDIYQIPVIDAVSFFIPEETLDSLYQEIVDIFFVIANYLLKHYNDFQDIAHSNIYVGTI